ncbi:MAG: hypothetical protein FWD78_06485 [Treponema sp.]|nr:hypothetical protein [Treponema sp.]
MSKYDKLIQKIFDGNPNLTPEEIINLLKKLGFKAAATGSSHLTFRKPECLSVTLVLTQNPVKSYIITKLQEVLINEGYKIE